MPLPPAQLAAFAGHDPAPDGDEDAPAGEYGGKGPFALPPDHQAGMRVPEGGSSCASCAFGHADPSAPNGARCSEPNFVAWNGGDSALPAPADEYCSDWWRPKGSDEE